MTCHCPYSLTQFRQPNQNASDFLGAILVFIGTGMVLAVAGLAFRAWWANTLCTIVLGSWDSGFARTE